MDEVQIRWLPQAVGHIDDHCAFLSERNERAAYELYMTLIKAADIFLTFPQAGPLEPLLADVPGNYRYLVVSDHYKLIYTVKGCLVEIHAVWDCRQSVLRLKHLFERENDDNYDNNE